MLILQMWRVILEVEVEGDSGYLFETKQRGLFLSTQTTLDRTHCDGILISFCGIRWTTEGGLWSFDGIWTMIAFRDDHGLMLARMRRNLGELSLRFWILSFLSGKAGMD